MSKLVFIQDIDIPGSPMVRDRIRQDVVEDYAELYKESKNTLPPVDLFSTDGKTFLIGDGMHRIHALISLKQKTVIANLIKGEYEEALTFALKSNERHGLRRSREDKRKSVQEAIKQWPKVTNIQLAQLCSVDNHTVKAVRDEMEKKGDVKPEPVRDAKDGRKMPAEHKKDDDGKSQVRAGDKDFVGTKITDYAMQFWTRTEEVKGLLDDISDVIKFLKQANKSEDLMYCEVNFSAAQADLEKVWANVATAVPYAICVQCAGQPQTQPRGECRMCKGRGMLSRFRWDSVVPAEIKAMKGKK